MASERRTLSRWSTLRELLESLEASAMGRKIAKVNSQLLSIDLHPTSSPSCNQRYHEPCWLDNEANQEKRKLGLANLSLPAQMFQAVAGRDDRQHRDDRVKDTPAVCEEVPDSKDSEGQQHFHHNRHTDTNLQELFPTMVFPLRKVPIVLNTFDDVPDEEDEDHSRTRRTVD
mmetsp:Transcript_22180/g.52230  ORF Transcript_22180/g.52230 Transcript_22180/m.52230 type:complete len:172 (+) Transcript_22180:72-587(+)